MELKVIAIARNGHTDKFGIPRQSREESPILTRIVFEPEYNVREALRGIEGYSHLWLIWGFSEVPSDKEPSDKEPSTKEWSPTVRPPRLGGNKRMGVFATRSPFRPNPIGLSSVKNLTPKGSMDVHRTSNRAEPFTHSREGVYIGESGRMELIVSGADVLDGTPIYDIKPYLSFSDSHPEAQNGFAEETKDRELEVDWSLVAEGEERDSALPDEETRRAIEYILSQDPRPGYQDDPEREYKMDYAGWRVTFRVNSNSVAVVCQVSRIG